MAVRITARSKQSGGALLRLVFAGGADGSEVMAGRFRTAFRESFRVLHVLTLEVLGAFFLALAILGAADTVRQYQMYSGAGAAGAWRGILALLFTLLTLGFGIQSFWKVRRIRK